MCKMTLATCKRGTKTKIATTTFQISNQDKNAEMSDII